MKRVETTVKEETETKIQEHADKVYNGNRRLAIREAIEFFVSKKVG